MSKTAGQEKTHPVAVGRYQKRLCLPSDDFKEKKLVASGRGRRVRHIEPYTV